jgi:hypothetical protein
MPPLFPIPSSLLARTNGMSVGGRACMNSPAVLTSCYMLVHHRSVPPSGFAMPSDLPILLPQPKVAVHGENRNQTNRWKVSKQHHQQVILPRRSPLTSHAANIFLIRLENTSTSNSTSDIAILSLSSAFEYFFPAGPVLPSIRRRRVWV